MSVYFHVCVYFENEEKFLYMKKLFCMVSFRQRSKVKGVGT